MIDFRGGRFCFWAKKAWQISKLGKTLVIISNPSALTVFRQNFAA